MAKREWTIEELEEIVRGLEDFDEFADYAIRFEEKAREVGEICDNSRDNPEREDEREYPEYDDPGYEDLPELDGTSGWRLYDCQNEFGCAAAKVFSTFRSHAYIITSDELGCHEMPDAGEVLMRDAKVVAVLL